jgi:hypothetical protein
MKSCHDGFAGTKTGHGLKESDSMGYDGKVSFVDIHDAVSSTKFFSINFLFRSGVFARTTLIWRMSFAPVQA